MPDQPVDHQNSPVDAQKVSAPPALAGALLAVAVALQLNFPARLRRRDSRMKMTSAVGNVDPERLKRRDSRTKMTCTARLDHPKWDVHQAQK